MIVPHQIQEWINELNNKRSNEMTRLTYLQKLEDLNGLIHKAIMGYKSNKKMNKSLETWK
jgi:hypothetical protein